MPDAAGNIRGIALSGKAGETLERIKRQEALDAISSMGQGTCAYPKCACEGHQDDCPFKREPPATRMFDDVKPLDIPFGYR